MATSQYISATFERVRHDANELNGVCCVHADGAALLFQRNDMAGCAVLERLEPEMEIFLCAEPSADGTWFLRWLHAPQAGTLEPATKETQLRLAWVKMLVCLLGFAACLFFAFPPGWGGEAIFLTQFASFLRLLFTSPPRMEGGALFLTLLVSFVFLFLGGLFFMQLRTILQYRKSCAFSVLQRLKAGESRLCQSRLPHRENLPERDASEEPSPRFSSTELQHVHGIASRISVKNYSRATGKNQVEARCRYTLECQGKSVTWDMNSKPSFPTPRTPPFMLAEGDRIHAVVEPDGVIRALYNAEDDRAFVATGVLVSLKMGLVVLALVTVMSVFISLALFCATPDFPLFYEAWRTGQPLPELSQGDELGRAVLFLMAFSLIGVPLIFLLMRGIQVLLGVPGRVRRAEQELKTLRSAKGGTLVRFIQPMT